MAWRERREDEQIERSWRDLVAMHGTADIVRLCQWMAWRQ